MQAEKREAAPAQMDQGGIILVETKAIVHNLEILKKQIKTPIMAVVKNNGYGLGLTEYAAFLQDQGITRFGVKDGEEALRLRAAGIRGEIFLLAPVLDVPQLVRLIRSDAVLCVDSMMTAQCAKRAGYLAAQTPCVQLKVDTGLGRYGFLPEEAAQAADVAALFQLKGIYTHFAEPYSDPRFTKLQYERFETFIGQLQHLGVQTGLRHCCATGRCALPACTWIWCASDLACWGARRMQKNWGSPKLGKWRCRWRR